MPQRIGFLLIDGFALMSYACAVEPLRAANLLGETELFSLRMISVEEGGAGSQFFRSCHSLRTLFGGG